MHAGLADRTVLNFSLSSATLEMLAALQEPAARLIFPHNVSRCLQCCSINAKALHESILHLREERWIHDSFR